MSVEWETKGDIHSSPQKLCAFFKCCDSAADQKIEGSGNEDARYVATMKLRAQHVSLRSSPLGYEFPQFSLLEKVGLFCR